MYLCMRASLVAQLIKNLPAMQGTRVWSLDCEDPLEEDIATHSSILAWRIPWTEKPSGLHPIGSHTVGHNWSNLACSTHTHTEGGKPCLSFLVGCVVFVFLELLALSYSLSKFGGHIPILIWSTINMQRAFQTILYNFYRLHDKSPFHPG